MPHHGRTSMLIETIRSIDVQMGDTFLTEVIVVTRDIDFKRHEVLTELRDQGVEMPIQIISVAQDKSISFSRNRGAAIAKGEYLAFVDSDVRLSPNWIACMLSTLVPGVVLSSAVQIPDVARKMNDVIRSAMSVANVGDNIESLPGANLFMRRDVFEESEKFLEHLQTCEDSKFTHSLRSKGKLVLTDRSGFVHLGEDLTFSALFKKEIWRGKSNIDLLFGSEISVGELPSILLPLLVSACLLVVAFAAALGYQINALCFLLLALLPGVLYALRLHIRSGIDLGMHKLVIFYSIYFVARGIGMTQRVFERKRYTQARVPTP